MRIEEFRKQFVDYIDESNELGVPAKITLNNLDFFSSRWVTVYGYTIVDDRMILLTKEYGGHRYEFTDKNIFNNIKEVLFLVDNEEISDFTLGDVSWSDSMFTFEGDF